VKRNIDIAFVADQLRNEIVALRGQIDLLTFERDEARREVCRNEANHLPTMADPHREARRRGWDCFKEDGK
jgi:hypothetical protein